MSRSYDKVSFIKRLIYKGIVRDILGYFEIEESKNINNVIDFIRHKANGYNDAVEEMNRIKRNIKLLWGI